MPNERFDFVADCPACNKRHSFEVRRGWLEAKLQSGEDVNVHCIYADDSWTLSNRECDFVRKQLAQGI